jgi:hypothetical protein
MSYSTYNYPVVPSEDSKLVQSSDEIPPCSDIAGDKYSKGENRERVHESEPGRVLR